MSKFGQTTNPPDTGFGSGGGTLGEDSFTGTGWTLVLEQTMTALIKVKAKNLNPDGSPAQWEMTVYTEPDWGVITTATPRAFKGTNAKTPSKKHTMDAPDNAWCCQTKCDHHQFGTELGGSFDGGSNEWEASILAAFTHVEFVDSNDSSKIGTIYANQAAAWDSSPPLKRENGFSIYKKFDPGHCPSKRDAVKMMKEVDPGPITLWKITRPGGAWFKAKEKTYKFGKEMDCPPEPDEPIVNGDSLADAMYSSIPSGTLSTYLGLARIITDHALPDLMKANIETLCYNFAMGAVPHAATALKILNTIGELSEATKFDGGCGPWCRCKPFGIEKCWRCEARDVWTSLGKGTNYECAQDVKKVDGLCPTGSYETQEACEKALAEQGCKDPMGGPNQ